MRLDNYWMQSFFAKKSFASFLFDETRGLLHEIMKNDEGHVSCES